MISTVLFGAFLIALGVGLIVWHVRAWQAVRRAAPSERGLAYAGRQLRRRTRASAIIAVIGVMICGSPWVTTPRLLGWYWMAVLGLLGWSVILAILDFFAIRQHFAGEQGEHDAQKVLLLRTLAAKTSHQHNGAPPGDSRDNA